MNINATLFVEMVVFASFVGLTRHYIWPPIIAIIEKRQADIAQGVEDARRGNELLQDAETKQHGIISDAKEKHKGIIMQAETAATEILEDAKQQAAVLKEQQVGLAQEDIKKNIQQAQKQVETETLAYIQKVLRNVIPNLPEQPLLDQMIDTAIGEMQDDH
jgi:F-type H+-transporting ATPase subunit b